MPTHRHKWLNELAVVAVFFAIVAIGLIYAIFNLDLAPSASPGEVVWAPKAPTLDEYRGEARTVLGPFLEQAAVADPDQLVETETVFKSLVDKTQERLLRLRVPAEAREAHLSFVLLLEQWRRALGGSAADQAKVSGMTEKVTAANPWLTVE